MRTSVPSYRRKNSEQTFRLRAPPSFRGARLRANPESSNHHKLSDSGFEPARARSPRNDEKVNALIHDRLIHQRIDLLAIVPADRSGRRGEVDHREFFLRIGPPVGAA